MSDEDYPSRKEEEERIRAPLSPQTKAFSRPPPFPAGRGTQNGAAFLRRIIFCLSVQGRNLRIQAGKRSLALAAKRATLNLGLLVLLLRKVREEGAAIGSFISSVGLGGGLESERDPLQLWAR